VECIRGALASSGSARCGHVATPVELSRLSRRLEPAPPILDTLRRRLGFEAVERHAFMGSLFIFLGPTKAVTDLNSNQISLVVSLDFQLSSVDVDTLRSAGQWNWLLAGTAIKFHTERLPGTNYWQLRLQRSKQAVCFDGLEWALFADLKEKVLSALRLMIFAFNKGTNSILILSAEKILNSTQKIVNISYCPYRFYCVQLN